MTTLEDSLAVAPAEPAPGDRGRLGAALRSLRQERRLTLVQVAEAAGLSHPFLSQIERGLASPSIGSLARIARALGSSQLEILALAGEERVAERAPAVVRAHEAPMGRYGAGEARLLATGETRFTPIDFWGEDDVPGEFFAHEEDEFVTVTAGSARIDLDAAGVHVLLAGDSLYYPGGTRHRWSSADGRPYRMLVVKDRLRPSERTGGVPAGLSAELPGTASGADGVD